MAEDVITIEDDLEEEEDETTKFCLEKCKTAWDDSFPSSFCPLCGKKRNPIDLDQALQTSWLKGHLQTCKKYPYKDMRQISNLMAQYDKKRKEAATPSPRKRRRSSKTRKSSSRSPRKSKKRKSKKKEDTEDESDEVVESDENEEEEEEEEPAPEVSICNQK
jgi:hypothetical protein